MGDTQMKLITNSQRILAELFKQDFADNEIYSDESQYFEFFSAKNILKNLEFSDEEIESGVIKIEVPNKYKKVNSDELLKLLTQKIYNVIAEREIERAMEKTRIMVGFAPEEFEIKKIKNLGTCYNQKITIHPEIVKYSREVIDYVVLHQYCHMKHKNHTKAFFKMLETYQPNYKKCEEILLNL